MTTELSTQASGEENTEDDQGDVTDDEDEQRAYSFL